MKIAIDCRTILNPGFGEGAGVGHYTYYLVWHLLRLSAETEFVLFFDKRLGQEAINSLIGKHPRVQARFFPFHEYRKFLPGVYSHLLAGAAIAREAPDILHVPGGNLSLSYPGKTILTVHDLAIYRHPAWFPFQPLSVKMLYPQSLRKADHLIVPSNQTAEDLQKIFGVRKEKISVIYEGVEARGRLFDMDILSKEDVMDIEDLKEKYKIYQPYLFYLGTIEPRKNLEFLIKVFDDLLEQDIQPLPQLVLAGARGWKYENIFKIIDKVNKKYSAQGEVIKYIGYVPHRDKWALFENAAVFVYPSLYEGFGLPPLEAMASGTPVLAANTSSLPEIIGKGGILLEPNDRKAWIIALTETLKKPQQELLELGEAGKKQAKKFSWSRCAEETFEIYQRLSAI